MGLNFLFSKRFVNFVITHDNDWCGYAIGCMLYMTITTGHGDLVFRQGLYERG